MLIFVAVLQSEKLNCGKNLSKQDDTQINPVAGGGVLLPFFPFLATLFLSSLCSLRLFLRLFLRRCLPLLPSCLILLMLIASADVLIN